MRLGWQFGFMQFFLFVPGLCLLLLLLLVFY
jgi:hypothetical protein